MSASRLRELLDAGTFVVTGECGPPRGADKGVIREKATYLRGHVDAVNVTDNQTSIVRMSSMAASRILLEEGLEPVMQMVCRDRNRIAMQSDFFGAVALDIPNLLCLSGDHQTFGNETGAKNVFDMDSIQLLDTFRGIIDDGRLAGGDQVQGSAEMFLGAACSPFADPQEFRVVRLAKKVAAGARFIQTQCVFDIEKLKGFMEKVRARGLHEKVHILAGVIPLKSLPMAKYMADNVSGVEIPDAILKRLKGVAKPDRPKEGIRICIEHIQQLREIEGIHGIHLMAIEWEEKVPSIVEGAGLLPRP